MNTRQRLALLYNDHSILENHHVLLKLYFSTYYKCIQGCFGLPTHSFPIRCEHFCPNASWRIRSNASSCHRYGVGHGYEPPFWAFGQISTANGFVAGRGWRQGHKFVDNLSNGLLKLDYTQHIWWFLDGQMRGHCKSNERMETLPSMGNANCGGIFWSDRRRDPAKIASHNEGLRSRNLQSSINSSKYIKSDILYFIFHPLQCTFADMFARETFTLWCEFADLPHLLTHLEENYARWKEQSTEWDPKKNNTNLLSRSRLDNLRWKVKTRHCLYAGILVTVIFPALTFLLFFFLFIYHHSGLYVSK